ncbi:saccharopine dehydrogenase C-terminal domain-containing protein [Pleionea sp. CnH1-48]|uniref:saccharopine dehydrogenase C-terminal domain-containing protein n=1 Tax=Pleionea sp. CnH1-48 TaxID=2954494 RepID=UPI002098115C|nr:saccharopine dehydrogenase C-terminal domain-containing protein [Pleionea sp. CnH1-48]MCO7222989.1 saccharopine dehydrogenase NADP-binding domain-containing protein [Pleionea sp. CnH1-48]
MEKSILILGAGFVAGPAVEYLTRNENNQITLVSHILAEAEALAGEHPRIKAMQGDVSDKQQMGALVEQHDLVISLVPYLFHVAIAELCIEHKKPMITASYVSPEMKALDAKASEAGVLVLNEIGLDPGIDHLSAMKIIDEVHAEQGEVLSFASWCGGLPAPECNNNPLGYKFAWAPRAVLLALLNEARFLKSGAISDIAPDALLDNVNDVYVTDEFDLEGYPNRDSSNYREAYNIPEVQNLIRGTLRYKGFAEIFKAARALGLLSLEPVEPSQLEGKTWQQWFEAQVDALDFGFSAEVLEALEWLGFSADEPLPVANTMLDVFCALLQQKLNYEADEFDMIVLQHKFEVKKQDTVENLTSTLVVKGEAGGFSAMAKTVGYPVAIACQLVLDGQITESGVKIPVSPVFYEPLLAGLEKEGIICEEKTVPAFQERFFD